MKFKFVPKNYKCCECGREQYTDEYCRGCGSQSFDKLADGGGTMTDKFDKSGVLGGNYDTCALDFEAAHQALLAEARKLGYAEGFEAGREHERNLPFANGQNPFKLGSSSRSEAETVVESAVKEARTFNQQSERDEIVEWAKVDVADLQERMISGYVNHEGNRTFRDLTTISEIHVNKKKRTVVALVKGANTPTLYEKGIAKCAPGDCFNVHIGKAIALRRALGLEVPSDYLNAPQPTEVRVGDVIGFPFDPLDDELDTVIKVEEGRAYVGEDEFYYLFDLFTVDEHDPECDPYIIDDSRETEVGE
ncbi:hypothetical protein M3626_20800 [Psychrobacillus sp. MER TA 17]|nr:hypothetical protein [Psychrobacillus sp. MER TA 17]